MKQSWPRRGEKRGIYAIENVQTGMVYIGQAQCIYARWHKHYADLVDGKHHSQHLQRSWNKRGEAAFRFIILEECDLGEMDSREQAWMDAVNSVRHGYNTAPVAGSNRGVKHKPEARERKSRALKLLWTDPAYRAKVSATRAERMGRPEVREHLRSTTKAAANLPGVRERRSAQSKARAADPVTATKIRDGHKRAWARLSDDERKARYARMQAGMSEETRKEKCVKTKQAMRDRSALSEADIANIRSRYKFRSPTDDIAALAREFGVNESLVSNAVHGVTWGSENTQVYHKPPSGYKGVTKDGTKWRGRLSVGGVAYNLGLFKTPTQAHKAVEKKRLELRGTKKG
jgi:group I intron endonuclease